MWRGVLFVVLGALGCQPEMASMMEGDPMDGSRVDAQVGMPDEGVRDLGPLRINHLQMRGTVNSYHDVEHDRWPALLGYTHLPLDRQAAEQGIRVFDFDLEPDRSSGIALHPQVTDDVLDTENHCGDWLRCLYQLRDWMDAHPDHPLVVIFVGESYLFFARPGLQFQLDDVEVDLVIALGRERVLSPADVRGRHRTLRAAIEEDGWPTVDETRGKAMFVLNDRDITRTVYIVEGGLDPMDRLLFVIGDPALADDPHTGDEVVFTFEPGDPWVFETDPARLGRLTALARRGYLVHAISDESPMLQRIREAGAHFVGTRFPDELGIIPPEGPTTCNPVTRPRACDPAEIEPTP